MIRETRQIKYLIAQAPGVIPHPLPEVNFLMVEIPSPMPYIFMIPRGLSYKVFNLLSHPNHKYIWLRGGDLNH
jgi:hypothetical protein